MVHPNVPTDVNIRMGRREKGVWGTKITKLLDVDELDGLNDNGKLLLSFATSHDLELVNTFFRRPKCNVSHTLNGQRKTRINYILTR